MILVRILSTLWVCLCVLPIIISALCHIVSHETLMYSGFCIEDILIV